MYNAEYNPNIRTDPCKNLIIKLNHGFVDFNGNIVSSINPHDETHHHNIEFVDATHFKIYKSNDELFTANGANLSGIWTYINNKLYSTNKYTLSSQFNSVSTSLNGKCIIYFLNYGWDKILEYISERRSNEEVLELLTLDPTYNTFCVNVNNNGLNALMLSSSPEVVTALLQKKIDKYYSKDIKTSLLKITCEGYSNTYKKFKILVQNDVKMKLNDYLLHTACKWNKVEIIKFLIDNYVVDINQTDNKLETPLIIAAKFCNVAAVDLLVKFGASVSIRDMNDMSAMSYAIKYNQNKMCKILSKRNLVQKLYYKMLSKNLIWKTRKSKRNDNDQTIVDYKNPRILFQMENDAIKYMENNDIIYKCQEKNGRGDLAFYDYNKNRVSYIVENDVIISYGYG